MLVAVLGSGYYFYHTGYGGAAYTNRQIQVGDSLLLDKKAYVKRLPVKREVIAFRNTQVRWDPSSVNNAKYKPLLQM